MFSEIFRIPLVLRTRGIMVTWKTRTRTCGHGHADMKNADMENADMENADIKNADMENADIENADKHIKILAW